MKISKRQLSRLIKESIDDFIKSDYVGTTTGATILPQQAYAEIRNWFENNIDDANELLRMYKYAEDLSVTDPKNLHWQHQRYIDPDAPEYDQNRDEYLQGADDLAKIKTSKVLPGGLDISEIKDIRAQYIVFLGDILLKNNKKLKDTLIKSTSGYYTKPDVLNQLNSFFEALFDTVDQIGVGPVNYEEFVRSKRRLGLESEKGYHLAQDEAPPESIPVVTGVRPRKEEETAAPQDSRSYSITNQMRHVQVTNGLTLSTIIVEYIFYADSEMLGNYGEEEILDQARESLLESIDYQNLHILGAENTEPSMDRYGNPVHSNKVQEYGIKLLVLGTDNEINTLIDQIKSLETVAEDIGMAMSAVNVEYDIDERNIIEHIQSNSMNSAIDFVMNHSDKVKYTYGIPTNAKSASGIINQHKDFLQIVFDYARDMDYGGDTCSDPDLGQSNINLIFNILQDMGHEYDDV